MPDERVRSGGDELVVLSNGQLVGKVAPECAETPEAPQTTDGCDDGTEQEVAVDVRGG